TSVEPLTATHIAPRSPIPDAIAPPIAAPSACGLQYMKRTIAFMRPWRRAGVIAWRSVSWAMLKSVPNADPKKIPTIRNGIAVERCESGMKTKKAEERIDGQTIVGPKPKRAETHLEPAAASSAPKLPSM